MPFSGICKGTYVLCLSLRMESGSGAVAARRPFASQQHNALQLLQCCNRTVTGIAHAMYNSLVG